MPSFGLCQRRCEAKLAGQENHFVDAFGTPVFFVDDAGTAVLRQLEYVVVFYLKHESIAT